MFESVILIFLREPLGINHDIIMTTICWPCNVEGRWERFARRGLDTSKQFELFDLIVVTCKGRTK